MTRRTGKSTIALAWLILGGPATARADATTGSAAHGAAPGAAVSVRFHVSVDRDSGNLTVHRETHSGRAVAYGAGGSAVVLGRYYERLCTVPCKAAVPVGTHQVAISGGTTGAFRCRS